MERTCDELRVQGGIGVGDRNERVEGKRVALGLNSRDRETEILLEESGENVNTKQDMMRKQRKGGPSTILVDSRRLLLEPEEALLLELESAREKRLGWREIEPWSPSRSTSRCPSGCAWSSFEVGQHLELLRENKRKAEEMENLQKEYPKR
jgi:hypothetical protein